MEMKPEKPAITPLDIRIVIAILICYLSAALLKYWGIGFSYREMKLEIIQTMTACITCLLCCQDNTKASQKAGINRMIITLAGGLSGMAVILLDNLLDNQWIMAFMVAAGVLVTLFVCKLCRVPYINARIGGVTFILVSCTLAGNARIYYAFLRLVSTLFAVLIVLLVTWAAEKLRLKKAPACLP